MTEENILEKLKIMGKTLEPKDPMIFYVRQAWLNRLHGYCNKHSYKKALLKIAELSEAVYKALGSIGLQKHIVRG